MEAILYNVSKNLIPTAIFLSIVLIFGLSAFISTHKFDIHKKSIRYFGLLTGLTNRQIIVLSAIMIRTFMIIYSVCVYEKDMIPVYIMMIVLTDIVYMLLVPKRMFFEVINIIAEVIIIYFINVLKTYRIEISGELYVGQVSLALSYFIIVYSLYFLLKNFEELITEKKKGKGNG